MRDVSEWIGADDNTPIPPRVKVRLFQKFGGFCQICTLSIRGKLLAEYDHAVALINGGANRENNIQLVCSECHKGKTRQDVAEKSRMARKRMKAIGIRKPSRLKSRGFERSPPQRTASRPPISKAPQ